MSEPDDLSFDPRSWFAAPDEAAVSSDPVKPAADRPPASRVLLAGLASAAILLTGAAAAFATRSAATQIANASGALSR